MDLLARRGLLETTPAPAASGDFVVVLESRLRHAEPSDRIIVRLRYIPDRRLVSARSLDRYLAALAEENPASLEAAAIVFLNDINNELVPRWAQVTFRATETSDGEEIIHEIVAEDRQPNWDNPDLLSRIPSS